MKKRHLIRIAFYSASLIILGLAYAAARHGAVPGYDPYFVPRQYAHDHVFKQDGRTWLVGGGKQSDHFDITDFRLATRRLEYGGGREQFSALIDPKFVRIEGESPWPHDDERVLLVRIGSDARVYPLGELRWHEVVNDTIGNMPVMIVFCPLADLAAVYERRIGDVTYTFAPSGYTYFDWRVWGGYSAFVLWDRETESLWWPPIGKAVSGPSIDIPLRVLDRAQWAQTTWAEVKSQVSNVRVMSRSQNYEKPADWPRRDPPQTQRIRKRIPAAELAPRWGGNPTL